MKPITRQQVYWRDRLRCVYCLGEGTTLDHVRPQSAYGTDDPCNLLTACQACNNKRGHRSVVEFVTSEHPTSSDVVLQRIIDALATPLPPKRIAVQIDPKRVQVGR